ncbi:hypothetical protein HY640_04760 [Candidatus Woesearchaeota archaeon]|nr:hypothetical protein [Candidatus Woesearchaeota archaeon]
MSFVEVLVAADEYAFEGYPVSEVKSRYGVKPYRLESYELDSIREVKSMLASMRYRSRETVEEHIAFMESLVKKLNLIAVTEEREGVMNLELRQSISEVRGLCAQLVELSGKVERAELY